MNSSAISDTNVSGLMIEPFMTSQRPLDTDQWYKKVFRFCPLLGDYSPSDKAYEVLFSNAKKAIDKLVICREERLSPPAFSLSVHEQITLAVICMAKTWNSNEESKFSRYVAMQFGYKDDSGKLWNLITKSLEQAFTRNNKLFIRRNNDREFYETVMAHSFGPQKSWYPLFDLLFNFYIENLDWNYVPNDPLFVRLVKTLNRYFNNDSLTDDEYQIASKSYCLRVGARRIVQICPHYAAKLYESIVHRMHMLVHHSATETRLYSFAMVDQWFADKLTRSRDIYERVKPVFGDQTDIAFNYNNIVIKYTLSNDRVLICVPAIRLLEEGDGSALIELFLGSRSIGKYELEVQGNELGETIRQKRIELPIECIKGDSIELRAVISRNGKTIFDSGDKLFRQVLVFDEGKEVSLNKLKNERYCVFAPNRAKLSGANIEIINNASGLMDVVLHKEYLLEYGGAVLAMDYVAVKELRVVQPTIIRGVRFDYDGFSYSVLNSGASLKIYLGDERDTQKYQLCVNGSARPLSNYFDAMSGNRYVVPFSSFESKLNVITIVDLKTERTIFRGHYISIDNFSFRFNREYYLSSEEVSALELSVCIEENQEVLSANPGQKDIRMAYKQGSLAFDVPCLSFNYLNVGEILFGGYILADALTNESLLSFQNNTGLDYTVRIGSIVYDSPKYIKLYTDKEKYNPSGLDREEICLSTNERSISIGWIAFKDLFASIPEIILRENTLLWDGGASFIGNKDNEMLIELQKADSAKYSFPMKIGEPTIAVFDDSDAFVDGRYDWRIISVATGTVLEESTALLGDIRKIRFSDRTLKICQVTEDTDNVSLPMDIKPVFIDSIKFVSTEYVYAEDDVFDIYSGRMYWIDYRGEKRFFSFNYKNESGKYKVNPVKIIYINDRYLRIVNADDEGIYCFFNTGSRNAGYEITDRNPLKGAKNYKDILFYRYSVDGEGYSTEVIPQIVEQEDNATAVFARSEDDSNSAAKNSAPVSPVPVVNLASLVSVTQEYVIQADAAKRMLVNAGPGTGKTWTLIEKVIFLVNDLEVDPESIQVLCFSRAAVEVVRTRLREAILSGKADVRLNYVDIRSFDSFASQFLYWVKESEHKDILKRYEIESFDYDGRIRLFSEIVRAHPELIENCLHLIVDEVQDLVLARAEMVLDLIESLPKDCGITLFGDACQAIYDYQSKSGTLTSDEFYKKIGARREFEFVSFEINYRQTSALSCISDRYREAILKGDQALCEECTKAISNELPEFDEPSIKSLSERSFLRLFEVGNVGILTRSNAQALTISSILRKKSINHSLRRRQNEGNFGSWIGILFNTTTKRSFSKEDFIEAFACLEAKTGELHINVSEVWDSIVGFTKHGTGRVSCRDLLLSIKKYGKHRDLFVPDKSAQLTVSTVHRSKGLEYNTVILSDDLVSNRSASLEEQRVNYVALSRAREHLYKICLPDVYFSLVGERRCYSSKRNFNTQKQYLSRFEVGKAGDLSECSFSECENIQGFIREHRNELVGQEVYLERANSIERGTRYNVVLKQSGITVAYTTDLFESDLTSAIREIKNLPSTATLSDYLMPKRFSGIIISDIATEIAPAKGVEKGVQEFEGIVSWNTLLIEGYARAEYTI